MIERAVILAVGNPAHRSQLAYNRPRAMLPALGKPMIVRIMNRLLRFGILHYTVVVGENEGAVAAYLSNHWVPNAKVEFVLKSSNNSWTQILSGIARQYEQPFLITSYNSFTHSHFPDSLFKHHIEYPDALILSGAVSTLSKSQAHYFAIIEGHRVTEITNKKPETSSYLTLIDLAVCGQKFVDHLANLKSQTGTFHKQPTEIVRQYVQDDGLAIPAETAWILQVETDADLLTLNKYLLDEGQDAHILSELPYTAQIIPPVRIDPQVSVGQGAKIGPHVYLERGSSVGHEAVVQNAMILQNANVPARETVSDSILSSRGLIAV